MPFLVCICSLVAAAPIALARTPVETVLHSFGTFSNGQYPVCGVIRDSSGNLYGTTESGGAAGLGTVFKFTADGQQVILHSFAGGTDGSFPVAGVTRDSAGNLYGTANLGGAANAGVVYEIDAAGDETVLYSFTGGTDGKYPEAGVVLDSAGNLYGTTSAGGAYNAGAVYMIRATGQQTVLYSFTGGNDGGTPYAGVIRDSHGILYGTTVKGGGVEAGVVYKLSTAGQETVLHSFTNGTDGGEPYAGLTFDSEGNLYGTAAAAGATPLEWYSS